MAHATANVDAEVITDGAQSDGLVARRGAQRPGGGEGHVLNKSREELLGLEVGVVLLEVSLGRRGELKRAELEALLLEALDDRAGEAALDAVRLDHDVGALVGVRHGWESMKI